MSNIKYFSLAGQGMPESTNTQPAGARKNVVRMDGSIVPGCIFSEASWYVQACEEPGMVKFDSDVVLMLIGGDLDKPEDLGAVVELQIENDTLTLTDTCVVFVPQGAAFGNLVVKDFRRPLYRYLCALNTSDLKSEPAVPTEPAGKYAGNHVERYAPPDGQLPTAPEGFLQLLLYLDGKRLPGAPYLEAVWFCTTNDTGPEPHIHEDFDEFIGFMGTDPEHPEELNATVEFFVEDEKIAVTKSCVVYIPRGLMHSPIYIPSMDKPIIHFSGGNGGDYVRKGESGESGRTSNLYRK